MTLPPPPASHAYAGNLLYQVSEKIEQARI